VLVLDPTTGRVRVRATLDSDELVALIRLADGTLLAADLPGNRVLRVDPGGRVSAVARVQAPADLVADPTGTTLWVASIAEGGGVVRVDLGSGRVQPFSKPLQPHGIDRDANGDFYVHDGHSVSRVDGRTGAVARFADVDAFKVLVAADGSVYGVEGSPAGGRVVRIAANGNVTAVVGTGSLGPHRDGPALQAQILPSAIQFAADGSLLVAQVEPVPAIRRVDLGAGWITTIVRGR
jgi:DNA-binding beta-propeller fold protein YncE